ncbi:Uma2 family endonuclease [Streptomyces fuscigenes]|uniref:Uma2 family endonuclease n=1 Tax=Streptomyces fuscigenes TaxID=1528880 RepID=UPI0027DEFDEE|nr:Uma2 family endonuclease [Streptomyces fuscigenes]
MSARAAEPATPEGDGWDGWDDLVRGYEATHAPQGWTVEIIEGVITAAPPPSDEHNLIAGIVQRRLYSVIPDHWDVYQTLGLTVPRKKGLFIPDLVVAPRAELTVPGNSVAADRAELVVEITSESNANHDRIAKAGGYAGGGVPLYLLLDSWHSARPTFTLYGEPTRHVPDAARGGVRGEAEPARALRLRDRHLGVPGRLRADPSACRGSVRMLPRRAFRRGPWRPSSAVRLPPAPGREPPMDRRHDEFPSRSRSFPV